MNQKGPVSNQPFRQLERAQRRVSADTCQNCGTPFNPKKVWAKYCSTPCKNAFRKKLEITGSRFMEIQTTLSALHGRLGTIVAKVAGRQPLYGGVVAEIATLHEELGKLLAFVRKGEDLPADVVDAPPGDRTGTAVEGGEKP